MTGIAQVGAQRATNALLGVAIPVVQGTAPTWIPGLYWIDSASSYTVMQYNGSTWSAVSGPYLALLTADPSSAINVSDLTECTDNGYSRVAVTFSAATASLPAVSSNSNLITFGPFTVNMSLPAQWVALVTSASGTSGYLLDTWTLQDPEQVSATQSITIAAGALESTQS